MKLENLKIFEKSTIKQALKKLQLSSMKALIVIANSLPINIHLKIHAIKLGYPGYLSYLHRIGANKHRDK